MDISELVSLRELMLAKGKEYSNRLEKEVNEVATDLSESEQFSKILIDSTLLGIICLDEDDRVLFANQEIKRKLKAAGTPKDCIAGKKLHEIGIFLADSSWRKIADPDKQMSNEGHEGHYRYNDRCDQA